MRKLLSIIVHFCFVIFIYSDDPDIYLDPNSMYSITLEENSFHYLADKAINIRKEPSIKSEVIGKGTIGTEVQIMRNASNLEELYGINSFWYQVKINDIIGYVWGGLISSFEATGDFNSDGQNELLLCIITGKGVQSLGVYKAKYNVSYKLCKLGSIISEKPFVDDNQVFRGVPTSLGNLGFIPGIDLLCIGNGFGDGPGYASIAKYYYLRGNTFKLICSTEEGGYSDETISEEDTVKITYPIDSKKRNTMLFEKRQVIKDNSTGKEKKNEIIETMEVTWDGKDFLVKREKSK